MQNSGATADRYWRRNLNNCGLYNFGMTTIRCIPLTDEFGGPGKCIVTGKAADGRSVIAKAY